MEEHRPVPVTEAGEPERETARFVALFLFGIILFSPLLMAIFDAPGAGVFGVPLLYAYLFAAWAVLIVLAAWLSRQIAAPPRPPLAADG